MKARRHQWSVRHIAGRATWDEVEEALIPPIVTSKARDDSILVLGQTFNGRYLAVFVVPDIEAPTVFVITARDMNDSERRRYRHRKGKG